MARHLLKPQDPKQAPAKEKPYKLNDGDGLTLLVNPAGSKLWRLRFTLNGKESMHSLGKYPDVGLADARRLADERRATLAKGINPAAERKAAKVAEIAAAADLFETAGAEWLTDLEARRTPAYVTRVRSRYERDLLPMLKGRSVSSISATDLRELAANVRGRGVKETALRAVQDVCAIIRFRDLPDPGVSVREKLTEALPAAAHKPAILEPAAFSRLLRELDEYAGYFITRQALRLLPLVLCRPGELQAMRWADLELEGEQPRWTFVATKTGTPTVTPLSRQAVAILKETATITGASELVFEGIRKGRPISENTLDLALKNMGYAGKQSPHGFRASGRTMIAERLKVPPHIIERQLAHSGGRGRLGRAYDRAEFMDERADMLQRWADYLDAIKAAKQGGE